MAISLVFILAPFEVIAKVTLSFSKRPKIEEKSSLPPVCAELVYQWVKQSVERYGKVEVESWYWEVWNESDRGHVQGTTEKYLMQQMQLKEHFQWQVQLATK